MTYIVEAPRRPVRIWDRVLTIVLLIATLGALVLMGVLDLFRVAFIDSCPPLTCDAGLGVTLVGTSFVVMLLLMVAGTVVSIMLLVKRRLAWWVALATLVLIFAAFFTGIALAENALNHPAATGVGTSTVSPLGA